VNVFNLLQGLLFEDCFLFNDTSHKGIPLLVLLNDYRFIGLLLIKYLLTAELFIQGPT